MTMAKKPIAYPHIMDTLNAVVESHTAIHNAISEHAQTHVATLAAQRQSLSIKRDADRLMATGSADTSNTQAG